MDALRLLLLDIIGIFYSIKQEDLVGPVCGIAWLVILSGKLRGVDKRDPVAFATYLIVAVAFGVTLTIVVPSFVLGWSLSFEISAGMILGMFVLVTIRWFMNFDEPKAKLLEAKI